MSGKPTPFFYVVLSLFVVGLLGFAAYRLFNALPKGNNNVAQGDTTIDPSKLGMNNPAEQTDKSSHTTVQEYSFNSGDKLPPVKGAAAYKPLENETVKFALNVWAGWAPIILANEGFKADKVWRTPEGKEFRVSLELADDPVVMRDAYASGNFHIGWATVDMLPLFMEGFVDRNGEPRDSRYMPRVYQQIDWSNGGDGIVARKSIKSVKDLKGKTVVLAANSPSQYFLLNMLVYGGLQPGDVKFKYTNTAFEAAAAFNRETELAAAVSWAPDIYNLSELDANRMLVTTGEANKIISDVWFARADFAKDHPDKLEGIVRGIFDAMEELKTDNGKQRAAKLMSAGYSIPEDEVMKMFADAHNTNWAENYQFFVNQNNPTNFERVWGQAYYLYKKIGNITHRQVPFDQVMDNSIIKKLADDPKYKNQKDEYAQQFFPVPTSSVRGNAEDPILTNTVVIHFYSNSSDLRKKVPTDDGKGERLYDPNVDAILDKIAQLSASFGKCRVVIEGHADSSMKGRVPDSMVDQLSSERALAVKQALMEKYKEFDPNQFNTEGMGWKVPADPGDPLNHSKNRRVEIKIYPLESQ